MSDNDTFSTESPGKGSGMWYKAVMSAIIISLMMFAGESHAFQSSDLLSQYRHMNSSTPLQYIDVEAQEENKYLVSLDIKEMRLADVLESLTRQMKVGLSYDSEANLNQPVSIKADNAAFFDVLNQLIEGTGLEYLVSPNKNTLVIRSGREETEELQQTLTGRVTDAQTGEALPGVNIVVEGTTIGTTTNSDGEFEMGVPSLQETLQFSYIGYVGIEIVIDGRNEIHVELSSDIQMLDDLIVVGYGTRKETSVVSAVSSINAEAIQTTTNSSLAQKIQGKIPGLQIRQNSGQPGNFDTNINIRGFGGSPLYIIDGIPRGGSTDFQMLNPADIESISVLKDASAAIYGVRAGHGVIIVTTKQGVEGRAQFSYSGTYGFQSPTNIPDMSTASQWAQIQNDAAVYGTGNPFFSREILQNYIDGAPGYGSTNWYKATMKNRAVQSSHNISASGGTERLRYHISGGNFIEQGLLKTDAINYERFSLRTNVTAQLTDQFEATVLLRGMLGNRDTPVDDFFNIFKGTGSTLPIESPYVNGNTDYPSVVSSELNPVVLSDPSVTGYNEHQNKSFESSINLKYNVPFLEGLAFQGILGYDFNTYFNKILNKSFNLYSLNSATGRFNPHLQREGTEAIYNYDSNFDRYTLQGMVNYEVSVKGNHNINAILVYEQQQTWSRWTQAKRDR